MNKNYERVFMIAVALLNRLGGEVRITDGEIKELLNFSEYQIITDYEIETEETVLRQEGGQMMSWESRYDAWKLATPWDDEKPSGIHCSQCGEEFMFGQSVLQEGVSGEYYCDSDCYRNYIRENIEQFFETIEEEYEVGEVEIEEDGMYE